ncbi:MAG: type II toxin-antitoxin system VapC family toxin [Alphaproteobacteria bacterium]|nr:type II toxin-antitoxin system VapC family toxin [Alphaproteobacteria bacterium]
MTHLIIDASVAIKWVVPEPETRQALALRRHRLFAPDLLVAECANVLWKKVRRSELTPKEAEMAARLLEHTDVELAPMRQLLEAATTLALVLDHPAYDCIYLALAERLSCDFVTADQRLQAKTLPTGYKSKVIALAAAEQ